MVVSLKAFWMNWFCLKQTFSTAASLSSSKALLKADTEKILSRTVHVKSMYSGIISKMLSFLVLRSFNIKASCESNEKF